MRHSMCCDYACFLDGSCWQSWHFDTLRTRCELSGAATASRHRLLLPLQVLLRLTDPAKCAELRAMKARLNKCHALLDKQSQKGRAEDNQVRVLAVDSCGARQALPAPIDTGGVDARRSSIYVNAASRVDAEPCAS